MCTLYEDYTHFDQRVGHVHTAMKLVFCFLAVAVVTAYAENCHRTSDCSMVACNPGFKLFCYRDNVCTCKALYSTFNCSLASECDQAFGRCSHGDHHWHCVDNRCLCRLPHD